MAKDTFYFTHDFNSRQDAKIKRLLMKHGMMGYGVFWSIIEDLYNNANALPTDYDSIAYDLRTDSDTIKSIVIDFGLFALDGDTFGSLSVQKRLDDRAEKSKKARDSAHKRWNKDANAMQSHSEGNAIKERKGKERKGKERKGKDIKEIVNYLNVRLGTNYKYNSKATADPIKVRLNDGYSVDDFKTVIDKKANEWESDEKFSKFLRPSTLFSPKFESYLNQVEATESREEQLDVELLKHLKNVRSTSDNSRPSIFSRVSTVPKVGTGETTD